jgi:hypothetical protein
MSRQERQSLSSCEIVSGSILAKEHNPWILQTSDGQVSTDTSPSEKNSKEQVLSCTHLRSGTFIRIQPMEYYCGGWAEEHFHHQLRLPIECHVGKGIVCLLEGKKETLCVCANAS